MKTPWTSYLIWIPITIIYNILACWVAVKLNNKDFVKMWFWLSTIAMIPSWSIAAFLSKNLIIDSLIYDTTLVITSIPILYFLGQGYGLSTLNWIGVVLVICGIILTRI